MCESGSPERRAPREWPEITAKQVELQEAFPDPNRLSVLWDTVSADQLRAAERTARGNDILRPLLKCDLDHTRSRVIWLCSLFRALEDQ